MLSPLCYISILNYAQGTQSTKNEKGSEITRKYWDILGLCLNLMKKKDNQHWIILCLAIQRPFKDPHILKQYFKISTDLSISHFEDSP